MKNLFTILLSIYLIIFITGETQGQGWRSGEKLIKVPAGYFNQVNNLHLNYDYESTDKNYIPIYVIPEEIELLTLHNIPFTVEIEDLNNYNKDFFEINEAYHTYQQIVSAADSLQEYFPALCKKYLFGLSMGNRQCMALKISDNVNVDENEAEVMFDGGIHGDEIGGPENLIRLAKDLVSKYGNEPLITELIDNREIWLYFMVNPDGRVNMSRYNMNYIDLNRDWAYMWSSDESPSPCSQIESKNLRNCLYSNQFVVYTSYHSGTEFVSFPWSYRPSQILDYAHTNQLASIYSTTSGYSGLPYEQGYAGMYPINGSTKDAGYGLFGAVSWSIEISYSKQPPASQIIQYYTYNYTPMINLIKYSGYGIQGTVTDTLTGQPIPAIVFINNYYPCYNDSSVGDFHKYVLPGTYSVTVKANGYQSKTINNVVVTANSAVTVDFQLHPGGNYYAYKICSVTIPGNNFSDEGLTPALLSAPDNINYSIGKSGYCVVDMNTTVMNWTGPDITVYEGDTSPEGYTCYASNSMDGPWVSLGTGSGTHSFDLGSLQQARYIKILDDGDGTAVIANAGFDLDAIANLNPVPVELLSFDANTYKNKVELNWSTATELNNKGFIIERAGDKQMTDLQEIGFVKGNGTTEEISSYSFMDNQPLKGIAFYRLKQIDFDGSYKLYGPVEVNINTEMLYSLEQNYPNPFNPSTEIKYQLQKPGQVSLKLYDIIGNEIAVLVDEYKSEGIYSYNLEIEKNGLNLVSGVYFYVMESGSFLETRKMLVLK